MPKTLRKTRPAKPIHLREHYVCHFTEYIASYALAFTGDDPHALFAELVPDLCTECPNPTVPEMQEVLNAHPLPAEDEAPYISDAPEKMRALLDYPLHPWIVVGDPENFGNPTVGFPTVLEAYEEARVRMGIGSPFSGGRLSDTAHAALDMRPIEHFNYWETWNAATP